MILMTEILRLTACISGKAQESGYRDGEFEFFLDTDTSDRYFELMIEASREIKELQAIIKDMKDERLVSHE